MNTLPCRSRKLSISNIGCSKKRSFKRMPAEKELARQVVVVVGAGSGIGKETAHRLVKDGAHIVSVDLNKEAAEATAKEIEGKYGTGIGVAGSGSFRVRSGDRSLGEHYRSQIDSRDA